MDWSPPPKNWNGRDTVWPQDPRTGGVTVLLLFLLGLQFQSQDQFYRLQVGIQLPEGVTSTRGVLRRFNDFLKQFSDLKKAFPRKSLPSAPPKGLMRIKSRELLEESKFRSFGEDFKALLVILKPKFRSCGEDFKALLET